MNMELKLRSAPMAPGRRQALRVRLCLLILIVDCLSVFGGCLLGNELRFGDAWATPGLNLFMVVLPVFIGIAINSDAYSSDVLLDLRAGFSRAAVAYVFAVLVVLFLTFYLKANENLSRVGSSIATLTALGSMLVGRTACALYIRRVTGMRLVHELLILDEVQVTPPPGVEVLDTRVHDLVPNVHDPHMLNRLGLHLKDVDRVVIACPPERRALWALLLKGSSVNGHILASELDGMNAIGIGQFGNSSTFAVAHAPLDLSRRIAKRMLDLALTVPGFLFLAPLLIVTVIAIKLDSAGPVFFLQPRVGRGNRIFLMYKFRSMRADRSDHAGAQSTRRDDDRITRVGHFIRATSIDELPQLINVLKGEMSLVGPRPHALGSTAGSELFWEVDERYWHRHASKPGLTGFAQVRGFRGATKEREDLANRLNADLEYLNGWTIWRDLSILFSTLRVLMHRNAY
jgi:exopolysaccharide biosynthesis polyprenyl glycosylphosphotransferase